MTAFFNYFAGSMAQSGLFPQQSAVEGYFRRTADVVHFGGIAIVFKVFHQIDVCGGHAAVIKKDIFAQTHGTAQQFITDDACRDFPFLESRNGTGVLQFLLIGGELFHNGVKTDKNVFVPAVTAIKRRFAGAGNSGHMDEFGCSRSFRLCQKGRQQFFCLRRFYLFVRLRNEQGNVRN